MYVTSIKQYLFSKSISEPHGNTAFHLDCCTFRINAQSHILCTGYSYNLYFTCILINLHLSHMSYTCSNICTNSYTDTSSAWSFARNISEFIGNSFQTSYHFLILQVFQTEFKRIYPCCCGHNVDLHLPGEGICIVAGSTPCSGSPVSYTHLTLPTNREV